MEFRNLGKNILYQVCETIARQNLCDSLEVDVIYRTFPDIPDEKIASSIHSLVAKGLLWEDKRRSRLFLTDDGHSEIRSSIPGRVLPDCNMPIKCRNNPQ